MKPTHQTCLLFLAAVMIGTLSPAYARDWYVATWGSDQYYTGGQYDPFATINHALSIAASNETIYLYAGTYHENIIIPSRFVSCTVTIEGLGNAENTIIDGSTPGQSVIISDVECFLIIRKLSLERNGPWAIEHRSSGLNELKIDSCKIEGGVSCENTAYAWIDNTIIHNAQPYAIEIRNDMPQSFILYANNCLFYNTYPFGIGLYNIAAHIGNCSFLGTGWSAMNLVSGNEMQHTIENCLFAPHINPYSIPIIETQDDVTAYNCCMSWADYNETLSSGVQHFNPVRYFPNGSNYMDWVIDNHVQPDSPCYNTGSNQHYSGGTVDVFGNPRIQNDIIDIGAEEVARLPNQEWFVDGSRTDPSGNGKTWETAFNTIAEGLAAAYSTDTVFVAPSTYSERLAISRDIKLVSDDKAGNLCADQTIINAGGVGSAVTFTDCEALLKGFTLTGGSAANGGGISCTSGSKTATVVNCILQDNSATSSGGGVYAACPMVLVNCVLLQNTAGSNGGGLWSSALTKLYNCTLHGNNAAAGGGLYRSASSVEAYNTIIWGNTAATGPEYYPVDSSIVFNDCTVGQDPFFVDPPVNLNLRADSICIDAGLDSSYNGLGDAPSVDAAGQIRKTDIPTLGDVSHTIDQGAYEFQPFERLYVDLDLGDPLNDGRSWQYPIKYLQDALATARASGGLIQEIWVADGTYYPDVMKTNAPTGNNLRVETFALIEGVKLYGGFQGISAQFPFGETSIQDRSSVAADYPSVLSGDIAQNNLNRSFQVVTGTNLSRNTVLDRFTIKKGQSDGLHAYTDGAGMILNNAQAQIIDCVFLENTAEQKGGALFNNMSSPKLVRCAFRNNTARFGAAVFNSCQSSPQMIDCDFISNIAQSGGAVFNHSQSSPLIDRAVLRDNQANGSTAGHGGALYNVNNSNPHIANTVFLKNSAVSLGGAMYNYFECDPNVFNCTVTLNQAPTYGGFYHPSSIGPLAARDQSKTTIINSILWNNKTNAGLVNFESQYSPAVRFDTWYSCVTAMSNPGLQCNVVSDPLFYDGINPSINRTHTDGLMLQTGGNQECIDSGSNNDVDSWADVAMFKRIQNGTVDRGAYELGDEPAIEPVIVLLSWIDESYSNGANETYYFDAPLYDNHLASFYNAVNAAAYPILAKCMVPIPNVAQLGIYAVLPQGYQPPYGITVESFDRDDVPLQLFVDELNELLGSPSYPAAFLLSVDNSGSMTQSTIEPGYTAFVQWLGTSYPGVPVYQSSIDRQQWVKTMADMLNDMN